MCFRCQTSLRLLHAGSHRGISALSCPASLPSLSAHRAAAGGAEGGGAVERKGGGGTNGLHKSFAVVCKVMVERGHESYQQWDGGSRCLRRQTVGRGWITNASSLDTVQLPHASAQVLQNGSQPMGPPHPSARRLWPLQQSAGRSPEQLQGSWGSPSRPPCSLQRVGSSADRVWAPAALGGTVFQGYYSRFMPLPAAAVSTPAPAHQHSSSRSADRLGATAGHWRPRNCCTVPGRQQPVLRTPQASPGR